MVLVFSSFSVVMSLPTMLESCLFYLGLLALSSALICPDNGVCNNDSTCCQTTSGQFGCCSLPNAECCADHLHCCYEGTVCDLEHSQCFNGTHILPWLTRVPALVPASLQGLSCFSGGHCCPDGYEVSLDGTFCTKKGSSVGAVICPDGEFECPDETTCCLLPDSSWGCCPMAEAVCCEDRRHCCPAGTRCDLAHSRCLYPTRGEAPLVVKFPAKRRRRITSDVTCPDMVSQCPDETTCCQLRNGSYGCCPLPRAVCCSDFVHCCPEGMACDLIHSMCVYPSGHNRTWATKLPARTAARVELRGNIVPCNDSVACPDNTTCCRTEQGDWACCSFPQAVCCSDHIHCCPHGTTCNEAAGTCDESAGSMPWLGKVPTLSWEPSPSDNQCNSTVSCPGQTTCCRMATGAWACCPLPQAVCCDDHIHCCPQGTICNVAASTCDSTTGSVPWQERVPARVLEHNDEKCDMQTVCPGGTTCCRQNSGEWACCPLPHAVCCDDQEHCCPKGYTCDVSKETCTRPGGIRLPWFRKQPAQQGHQAPGDGSSMLSEGNRCDDHTSCPKDNTCCFMAEVKKWGCCPLPKAVCCKDGEHCCPNGYHCNPQQVSCIRGHSIIPWYRKQKALLRSATATDVKCDTQSTCPAGTTCCRLATGHWGCCPLVQAVCCSDHEHCCPQGYICNMKSGTCDKEVGPMDQVVPMSLLSDAHEPSQRDEEQCTGCSRGETCCRTSPTAWACCPLHKAVCCSDTRHCCPAGYTCDLSVGSCTRSNELRWDFLLTQNRRAIELL